MRFQKPNYDFDLVRIFALDERFVIYSRAFRFLLNRYPETDPSDIVKVVVLAIKQENFYKSVELEIRPGVFADIYRNIRCEQFPEEAWYVKFLINKGTSNLEILSMNWDGYIH